MKLPRRDHSQSTASTPAITDHLSLKVVVNLIAAFLLHHLLLHYSIVKIYLLWFQKSLGLDWLRPQLTPPSHLHTELDLLLDISTIYLKNLIWTKESWNLLRLTLSTPYWTVCGEGDCAGGHKFGSEMLRGVTLIPFFSSRFLGLGSIKSLGEK